MKKRVRRRAKHTSKNCALKGVIYLPKPFIGSVVKVLTLGQYKSLLLTVKHLKCKVAAIRRVVYEYSRT